MINMWKSLMVAMCAAMVALGASDISPKKAHAYDSCGGGSGQSKHALKMGSGSGPTHCKTQVCHTVGATSQYWFMDPFTGEVTSYSYVIDNSNGGSYSACPSVVESRWQSP